MSTKIRHIDLDRLLPHPDNPTRMSRTNLDKLIRTIEWTGRYEPLVVRPHPRRCGYFQIINGCHRCEALRKLGHRTADAVVWPVNDEQAAILLMALNRLTGRDVLDRKLTLLRRLSKSMPIHHLAKLLPSTRGQLERLMARRPLSQAARQDANAVAVPLVFFVDEAQRSNVEDALSAAGGRDAQTRAVRRAAALAQIARRFLDETGTGTDEPHG